MDPLPDKRAATIDELLLRLSALKEKVTRLEERVSKCKSPTSLTFDGKSRQKR